MLISQVFLLGCEHLESERDAPVLFPASSASNFQQLVSVHWLKALLDFKDLKDPRYRPVSYENDHFVILEASWASLEKAAQYHAGHVPGAIHINTDDFENGSPRWRLRSDEELQGVVGKAGITPQSTVIVYGEQLIAAARVWWILKYAGVADVRLLDGGFKAWKAAGYPVETRPQVADPVTFSAPVMASVIANTEYVRRQLGSNQVVLADVRSEGEYRGLKSGYSYLEAKGRIPGAIHLGNADDQNLRYSQRNGRLRSPSEVRALWAESGLSTLEEGLLDQELIFYCGGGWRSSLAFFYASLLGVEKIRNYSDGWSAWSTVYQRDATARGRSPGWRQDPSSNPIASGRP